MTRLTDLAVPVDREAVPAHLARLAERCGSVAQRIRESAVRSDRSLAFENFCHYAAGELRHVSNFYPTDVAGLAWASRNLFELNLIVRHVLGSEENLWLWLGQSLNDEREFVEGVLSLPVESELVEHRRTLEKRIASLTEMAERHSLKFSKPFRMRDLAQHFGQLDEYSSLFKLFSKYVHPSSLVINAYARRTPEDGWLNIFLIKSQFYAGDTIGRISEAFGLNAD
jgi:Family of unknown function (DUF5677)